MQKKNQLRIGFWNVAGINNKDEEFWEYIKSFDVIGMTETWIEENRWEKTKKKLPGEYKWKATFATKEKKKGRAKGGIITGIRNNIEEEEAGSCDQEKNIQERCIKLSNEKWRIFTVYSNNEIEKIQNFLAEEVDPLKEYNLVLGGDMNARTAEEGDWTTTEENDSKRQSKDRILNKEGKKLITLTEERGWNILNGNMTGDEDGEFTYWGPRGKSVIDYIITNNEATNKVEKMKVESRVETEHQPIAIEIKEHRRNRERENNWKEVEDWTDEGKKTYTSNTENITFEEKNEETNKMLEELKDKIRKAIVKKKIKINYKCGTNK